MTAASQLLNRLVDYIINPTILLIFAAGLFMFMLGLVEFMWSLRGGEIKNEGKQHMLWGTIGMLIMVSVYGIIALIDETFNLDISNPDVSRIENVTAPANFFGR